MLVARGGHATPPDRRPDDEGWKPLRLPPLAFCERRAWDTARSAETTGAAGTRSRPASTAPSSTPTARRSGSPPSARPRRPRTSRKQGTSGGWRDPNAGQETFGEYANRWYAAQDLAASTMQNYRRHIEEHLLPDFEDKALAGILRTDVDAVGEEGAKAVYAASSVKTWRSTLSPDPRGRDRRGADHDPTRPPGGAGAASAPAAPATAARRRSSPTRSASC